MIKMTHAEARRKIEGGWIPEEGVSKGKKKKLTEY